MTRVGVLGLGRMGAPIAARLAAAGFDVRGYDPAAVGPSSSSGTGPSQVELASWLELVETADILLTILPGAPEFDAAAAEILAILSRGALWIDLTSNDPRIASSVGQRAADKDVDFVGAPMGGGPASAASGTLRFFAGGEAVDRTRPVLDALGVVEHVGDQIADGYAAKLLANLLWFGQVVAVSEALLLGKSLGLAPATLRATLATSAGGSVFIDEYLDSLLAGDYLESFGIDRVVEELEILASIAGEKGVPFELSGVVTRLHRQALERFGAVRGELLAAKLLEERAGTTLRA